MSWPKGEIVSRETRHQVSSVTRSTDGVVVRTRCGRAIGVGLEERHQAWPVHDCPDCFPAGNS